ncbi:uncharacterized protein FPOAC1_014057 [Fusarium poae]|uniref:uncharacterized protein n=1 Tax=Fusarium poae TaxID=36050 RepID=UPI001D048ED4|nr:uncharacterized protein FPOAC1_014057 [Fusarium poae]KAG8664164.1 hypothetical protein FPOAC1_014057 [Fusarium poae]
MSSSRRPSHQTHLKEAKDLEEQLSRKTQEALRQKKDYEAELAKKDAEIKTLKEEILVLQIENAVSERGNQGDCRYPCCAIRQKTRMIRFRFGLRLRL